MSILIDQNTKVLVLGITGKEGLRSTKEMIAYGTKVIAGVTPGKGGQDVDGIPVYDNVKEALLKHPEINAVMVYVPPAVTKDAVLECIAENIKLIHIIAEGIPILDSAYMYAVAKRFGCKIIGPSSVGIISPGKCRIGSIGGSNPDGVFMPGNIGFISKSGGMASEISWILKRAGFGVSTVVAVGGDVISCTTFEDLMELYGRDINTKALVLFGEIGGTYEEKAAQMIKQKKFTKPVVAFISGIFAEKMPGALTLGHAGAIVEGDRGTQEHKVRALAEAGALVAKTPDEIPELLKKVL